MKWLVSQAIFNVRGCWAWEIITYGWDVDSIDKPGEGEGKEMR